MQTGWKSMSAWRRNTTPKYFDRLVDFLRQEQVEYMILGQHFVGNEPDGVYSGQPTADNAILEAYVRQGIAAMDTGLYTYMAHPDILNFTGNRSVYDEWMGLLVREAKDHGLPLEFNFLGFREGRNYPDRRFLELVAQAGLPMVLGCDAHQPEALKVPGGGSPGEGNARKAGDSRSGYCGAEKAGVTLR